MRVSKFVTVVALAVIVSLTYSAVATDILYDFEDQTDRANVVDVLTADGSQNGQAQQSSGNGAGWGPTLGATDGVNGSGGFDFINIVNPFGFSNMLETKDVVDFTTAMSFSVDINPNVAATAGKPLSLFWTGKNRGLGETAFVVDELGRLKLSMNGLNPGGVQGQSTVTNQVQLNQYQSVGFTLGLATDEIVFYVNGVAIETITSVGAGQATLPGNGHATGSPVQVGWLQNIGLAEQTQYTGLVDNVFISDRLVDAAEMASRQIPEPATLTLLGLGAVGLLRRRK
jgi:hypothetical protein